MALVCAGGKGLCFSLVRVYFPIYPISLRLASSMNKIKKKKKGGEAGRKGFSANEKKAWRKIWCGFFFDCGCNGHGAHNVYLSVVPS